MSLLVAGHPAAHELGVVGWVALGLSSLVVAWSIWRAVVLTVDPGEAEPEHIKRLVLQDPRHLEIATEGSPQANQVNA
jgi:hypothetical protein